MDPLYTTHDVARLVSVDPSTVSKWIDRSLLIAFKTPGGHRRIREADLLAFLRQHEMPIPDELGSAVVRLVVVDNEKPALDALKKSLKPYAARLELHLTTSGMDALLIAADLKPHGFLVDLNLPDLDGYEVCKTVRARSSMSGTRVVTMTSRHRPDAVTRSLAVGAVACLPKPVPPEELLELFRVPIALAARSG